MRRGPGLETSRRTRRTSCSSWVSSKCVPDMWSASGAGVTGVVDEEKDVGALGNRFTNAVIQGDERRLGPRRVFASKEHHSSPGSKRPRSWRTS